MPAGVSATVRTRDWRVRGVLRTGSSGSEERRMTMKLHTLPPRDWGKAAGVGLVNGLLLSAVMVPAFRLGISPFPKPVGLAFAETLLGGPLPLHVGLLFHLAYVTFWSMAFVALSRQRLTLRNSLLLALVLWIGALVVFFPVIGWGFFGLTVGLKLIAASFVPHLLFGLFLWALCRATFRQRRATSSA
jgi:hypothetical protein